MHNGLMPGNARCEIVDFLSLLTRNGQVVNFSTGNDKISQS